MSGIWGMIESDLHRIRERNVPVAFDFADKPEHETLTKKALPFVDTRFSHDAGSESRSFMIS